MSRTRVRRRRMALLAIWLVAATLAVGPLGHALSAGATSRRPASTRYVVKPGDTLWGIARATAPSEDPRVVVARIAGANAITDGELTPGRSLLVPLG
jgi:LysM domain